MEIHAGGAHSCELPYSVAGTTSNLTASSSGAVAGTGFSPAALSYATEVGENEIDHVRN